MGDNKARGPSLRRRLSMRACWAPACFLLCSVSPHLPPARLHAVCGGRGRARRLAADALGHGGRDGGVAGGALRGEAGHGRERGARAVRGSPVRSPGEVRSAVRARRASPCAPRAPPPPAAPPIPAPAAPSPAPCAPLSLPLTPRSPPRPPLPPLPPPPTDDGPGRARPVPRQHDCPRDDHERGDGQEGGGWGLGGWEAGGSGLAEPA
jgi:hypothetical protein